MCPHSFFLTLTLGILFIFFIIWIPRQYSHVKKNFNTFAELIDSPQVKNIFNFVIIISGYYRGRKVGWSYRIYQDNQRCTWLYIEPHCKIKVRHIVITEPSPTKHTVLRGKRIYFVRELFQDEVMGGLIRDPMPLFTKEDILDMLEELTTAAEIVETSSCFNKT